MNSGHRWWPRMFRAIPVLTLASGILVLGAQQEEEAVTEEPHRPAISSSDCSFLQDPAEFTPDRDLVYMMRSDEAQKVSVYRYGLDTNTSALNATDIPRRNFIDDAIFNRMAAAGIQSAPLASDVEFLRRVMLDLTGRIPSPEDVNGFVANTSPGKRDALIDSLIGTPEFVDKWTMFFGDLFKNNATATNVQRFPEGRDAFYLYIKEVLQINRPYDVIARDIMQGNGDSFALGPPNWLVGGTVPMGPAQDTYDGQAVNLASMFLGISTVDCLLCHDGTRHLDRVNLWGSRQTRQNMWGLSSFFARTRMARQVVTQTPLLTKFIVSEVNAGTYQLNTTTGNRSARQPISGVNAIAPRYPFASGGTIQPGQPYREALAHHVTADLQFSRAAVNYIWERFMVEAFVSPSNSFDPARLDASRPPPAPWTLQPTNPELLDALARWFQQNRYDLRALMKLITQSSAYQLSASYPGTWNVSYVPYYARKFVRRLDAEEIHDAVVKATGVPTNYTLQSALIPAVQWAMQLPDTREPRAGAGNVIQFLDSFGRGDRDQLLRRSDGSLLQTLNMMNSPFVMGRIHQANAGSRVSALLSQNLDATAIIRQLYLSTLSRPATSQEIALFLPSFQQQGNRVAAEGLQWVLLNKLDFIFNY